VHLGDEGLLLDCRLGVVEVVVVEADFADGDATWIGGEGFEFRQGFVGCAGGLLRVNSDAGVEGWLVVTLRAGGDFEGLLHGGRAFADAYGQDGVDSCGVGSAENVFAVFGVEVEMGVGINEGHVVSLR
jgi:hypothetical protein